MLAIQPRHGNGDQPVELAGGGLLRRVGFRGSDEVGQGCRGILAQRLIERHPAMPAAAEEVPVSVAGEVQSNPVEPGGEGRFTAKPTQTAPGANEGVLGDFFRIRRIVQQIQGQPVDPAAMAGDDLVKGGRVTLGETLHELGIDYGVQQRLLRRGRVRFTRRGTSRKREGDHRGYGDWMPSCTQNHAIRMIEFAMDSLRVT